MKRLTFILIFILSLFAGKVNAQCVNAGPAMAAICQGGTSAALGGSFTGTATSAVWSDGGAGGSFTGNAGATPDLATYTASLTSVLSVTLTLTAHGGLCEGATTFKLITVNPNLPVSVSIAASANPVCAGTSVIFTATATNGGASPSYQWKVNNINAGTNSATYTYISSGQ